MRAAARPDPIKNARQRAGQLFAVIVLFWFSLYVYMPYQSLYLSSLGLGAALVGLTMGSYGYAQLLLRLPLGLMADRLGRPRLVLVWGVGLPVLASLLRLIWPLGGGWLLANLLSGIGASTWICFFIEMDELRGDSALHKSAALVSAGNQLGIMSGYLLSVFLYREGQVSRLLWASVLAGTLALFLLLDLFRKKPSAPAACTAESAAPPPLKSLLKHSFKERRLLRYAIFGIPQTGLLLASAQSFSVNHCRTLGGSELELGLMSVLFMGSALCFALLCTLPFARRLNAAAVLTTTHLLMLAYFLLVPLTTRVLPLLLCQLIAGLYSGTTAAFAIREAMRQVEAAYANTSMAVYQTAVGAGISFLPLLSGLLVEKMALAGAYRVLGLAVFLLALYAAWLGKLDRAAR